MKCAYVTLVTNADYAVGALALARSLRLTNSTHPLIAMVTDRSISLADLEAEGCRIVDVAQPEFSSEFRQRHSRHTQHSVAPFTKGNKPAFHDPLDNFCKLRLWQLTEFDRVVFLDADVIVVRNIDKLFSYPEFSAAPNLYETLHDMHRLNSGVFVAHPSTATYGEMMRRLDVPDVFWRRTDQTFLESFFPDWHGLPYVFNTLQYVYFNLPGLWYWPSIRVVHYQYEKPWEKDHPKAAQLGPLIALWHQVLNTGTIPDELPVPSEPCASQ